MDNEKNIEGGATVKSGILAKLENFWYHYKWHSLIALFLVFTITVCTLQMCEKKKYDVNVLYAGGYAFSRDNTEADYSEYQKLITAMRSFTEDHDNNGKISVSFRDLYTPNEEELSKVDGEAFFSRAYEDRKVLSSTMMTGGYFLCFFSPDVFKNYDSVDEDGVGIFVNLSAILPEDASVEYYNSKATGIKLSSLDIYSLSGFSCMPEDTVVALRNTGFSTHLDNKKNTRDFERAKSMLIKMVEYEAQ